MQLENTVVRRPPSRRSSRAGVVGCPRAPAGQGEGADPRPRRDGRRAAPDAPDGRREGLHVRGPGRPSGLLDLFEGRRQLIVYRFFFEPGVTGWPERGCPRLLVHGRPGSPPRPPQRPRHHARVRLARPAGGHRALEGRMGWEIPWYTLTDDFDADFGVDEWHGTNAFLRDDDRIFRTYFVDGRGDEALGSTWSYLDITALGRQEEWEDSPAGLPAGPDPSPSGGAGTTSTRTRDRPRGRRAARGGAAGARRRRRRPARSARLADGSPAPPSLAAAFGRRRVNGGIVHGLTAGTGELRHARPFGLPGESVRVGERPGIAADDEAV